MSDSEDYEIETPALAEDDLMRAFMPTQFGKKTVEANVAAQINRTKRKVEDKANEAPKAIEQKKDDSSDNDSDDDSDEDSEDEDEFPTSHELVLKTHEKAVTTITLDPNGTRLISGGTDCMLKLHDFAAMTPTTLRAFKSVDPHAGKVSENTETHPINHVEFTPHSGSQFLCITEHPQARIMSRDGEVLTEFVKGDMYIRDMHNTKGHVSSITTGTWSPTDPNLIVTAGTDSTIRIWDINYKRQHKEVLVHKDRTAGSGGRTKMTAVAWGSPAQGGNNILVAAALDGSLVMWSGNGPHARPAGEIRNAHTPGTRTGGVDISPDGRMIVTRGGDELIKLWDTRKFKAPILTTSHPSTSDVYSLSSIRYSPSGSNIILGSATGDLHILNSGNLKPELVTPVTPGSTLISAIWHSKLNQIITASANSEVHVLYNPTMSTKGAVEVMKRAPKKRHVDDDPNFTTDQSAGISGDAIITPAGNLTANNASSYAMRHPTIGLTASGRSRDPRRPAIPAQTPFNKGTAPDQEHISKSIPLSSMRDEDPREALLKYADKAQSDPLFTGAWKETQPKTIYAELSDEEEEEDEKKGPERKKAKY